MDSTASSPPNPRVLLVGECNPFGADPRYALYHLPRTSSGNRLRCVLGLTDLEYHKLLDKANLCDGEWSPRKALERLAVLVDGRSPGGLVVLLGAKVRSVARKFLKDKFPRDAARVDYGTDFFSTLEVGSDSERRVYACLPHPSGLCRLWNEPGSVTRARRLLAEHAPWVPWGARDVELPPARTVREGDGG
jgi:hypothetical protein